MIVRGPVSRSEQSLREAFPLDLFSNVGQCDKVCEWCGAHRWARERNKALQKTKVYKYSNCCQSGKVMLPTHYFPESPTPDIIRWLLTSVDPGKHKFPYLYFPAI
ncbi:hypothetical protein DFH28DRAFT_888509 [Melampsora americana]|nr:hypothetical protein DFH28DRAFT_888509 [Melampsora americana]